MYGGNAHQHTATQDPFYCQHSHISITITITSSLRLPDSTELDPSIKPSTSINSEASEHTPTTRGLIHTDLSWILLLLKTTVPHHQAPP